MSYQAKLTSKGQLTLPVELRERFGLKEGDVVEFHVDFSGVVSMRPLNSTASAVFERLGKTPLVPLVPSDDHAIDAELFAKDDRSKAKRRPGKSAA